MKTALNITSRPTCAGVEYSKHSVVNGNESVANMRSTVVTMYEGSGAR